MARNFPLEQTIDFHAKVQDSPAKSIGIVSGAGSKLGLFVTKKEEQYTAILIKDQPFLRS
jgi:hypothetical protein